MRLRNLNLLLFMLVLWTSSVFAQIPQLISYQGMLTAPDGSPVSGEQSILFSLYDDSTGGTLLWSETRAVTVTEGLFSLLLGTVTPIPFSAFDTTAVYLGLTVGVDPEMVPRSRLVSMAYAFQSYNASMLGGKPASSFVEQGADTSISTDMIKDDAVTADKIGPSFIHSIDGVSNGNGDVDLVPGNYIEITPDDGANTITIGLTDIGGGGGTGGDNLGNHQAEMNIVMGSYFISGDGDSEGIRIQNDGDVNVNKTLFVAGQVRSTGAIRAGTTSYSGAGSVVAEKNIVAGGAMEISSNIQSLNGWVGTGSLSRWTRGSGDVGATSDLLADDGIYGNSLYVNTSALTGGSVYGALGWTGYGVYGRNTSGYAGYFSGKLKCTGTFYKGGGGFQIDHPLDPEKKYLNHSFVESPDMMNVYNGNAVCDDNGEIVVTLPDYFESLNRDFRYQLTCIGGFSQIYIAEEIANRRFTIAGGTPGLKVSWQVTGIRKDPYAEANRIPVEVDKPDNEQGKYMHPEAYGMPETMSIDHRLQQEQQSVFQEQRIKVDTVEENE